MILDPNTTIRREYVLGFAFDDLRSRVLLIEKRRPDWQAGRLNGVGGKIEPGETPLDAMRREFKEETGLHFYDWQHAGILEGKASRIWLFRANEGRNIHRIADAQKTTDEQPITCEVRSLPNHVLPNVRWLVPLLAEPNKVNVAVEIYDYK